LRVARPECGARYARRADASDNVQRHPARHGHNDCEIAVTRKNYLFLGSDEGGRRAAHIYTIIEPAKLSGLNPHAYLAGIIDKMAKGWPRSRLAELLPWNWTATIAAETAVPASNATVAAA
jgi:hypothetical protein